MENFGHIIAADYDFMLRMLSADIKVKYISEILYKMRVGGVYTLFIKNISKVKQFFKK